MNWRQGYVATYRLYSVNQSTWGDGDEIDGLVSASVTKDGDSELVEDASISVDVDNGETIKGYVRLVLEAKNNSGMARADIGTFLVTAPKRSINNHLVTLDLECYSVLKPAADKLLPPGWYFPKGGDPIVGAYELLSDSLKCPVEYSESGLSTDKIKVAESNETALSMAQYLLEDTGYFIKIDGKGRVSIAKKPFTYNIVFDTVDNDVLMPDITDETDIFEVPNILRVTDSSGNYETIYNNDDNSSTSISALGWEKWSAEQLELDYGESLVGKGAERMEELSKSTRKISYTREFNPDVKLNDIGLYLLPQQGIVGAFRVISQSIELGAGVTVNEISEFETENWRA